MKGNWIRKLEDCDLSPKVLSYFMQALGLFIETGTYRRAALIPPSHFPKPFLPLQTFQYLQRLTIMGIAFDYAPDRPEHIENILNGLDRYNPETTAVFQDYVAQQCEDRTYDCYANLALLKL